MVIDDQELYRYGIIQLLEERGIRVVGEAGRASDAIRQASDAHPDVVLMDLNMPGMSGIEATNRLTADEPSVRVLVLTVAADERHVMDALMAGATGYILKEAPIGQIVDAIKAVARGESTISPRIASGLIHRLRESSDIDPDPVADELTAHSDEAPGGESHPSGGARRSLRHRVRRPRMRDSKISAGRDEQASAEVTVVLGDDQGGTRAGVRHTLETRGIRVLAEAGTAEQAIAAAIRHKPAVCVLAMHIPGGGIVAAHEIKAALPGTKVVMLSGSDRDEDLFAAIRAGADGYLLKTMSARRLPDAITGVLSGEAAIPRHLVTRLLEEFRRQGRPRAVYLPGSELPVEITPREFEVITRVSHGDTTAEIARDLRISQVTVRRHTSSVEHKLGAPNRRAAGALIAEATSTKQ
jgi:DNA-binding NarL/FixJ family response regulator